MSVGQTEKGADSHRVHVDTSVQMHGKRDYKDDDAIPRKSQFFFFC